MMEEVGKRKYFSGQSDEKKIYERRKEAEFLEWKTA